MLNVNPESVCQLIDRAREFHAKEGVVMPEETTASSGQMAADMLADHKDDPIFREFKSAVNDLEPDQQSALVALMWVGRGDFDASEWDDACIEADESRTPHTAEYLLTTPLVADYLAEGLAQLGYECGQ